jgi:predicted transport protein
LYTYLNIEINQINDPLNKARDVKDIGHYSSGKTEIIIADSGSYLMYYLLSNKHVKEARVYSEKLFLS